jgi:hypothetical protein
MNLNHEASQCNYGACSSAAGGKAEFCILHMPMLKCYNSTAPNWYQTLSEYHYYISARKPRQLWFGLYAVHSDPSSDGCPKWIKATFCFGLLMELLRTYGRVNIMSKIHCPEVL